MSRKVSPRRTNLPDESIDTRPRRQQRSPSPAISESHQHEFAELEVKKQSSSFSQVVKYIPISALVSAIGIFLYYVVAGLDLTTDLPYMAVALIIGTLGLASAYRNVAKWVKVNIAKSTKAEVKGMEHNFFSIFYNNAFYFFLLILLACKLFTNMKPTYSLLIAQLVSAGFPAWLSSRSV